MIASLHGTVEAVDTHVAVIDVHGIGFAVQMPSTDLAQLRSGQEITVHTQMTVSQDAIALYGFLSSAAKRLFLRLQKVSGVGPKAALSLLSTLTPDALIDAVTGQNVQALTRASGIGKKGAQKIILELAGQLSAETLAQDSAHAQRSLPQNEAKVVAGLVNLGWQESAASEAVRIVAQSNDFAGDIPDDRISDALRQALSYLGKA